MLKGIDLTSLSLCMEIFILGKIRKRNNTIGGIVRVKWKHAIPIAIGLLIVFFLTEHLLADEKTEIGIEMGNIAPDFEITTLEGEKVKLSDYRGKPVMLNFWATWCPPCRQEMPDMEQLHQENEIVVLGINLLDTEINENSVQKFVDQFGLTFDIGLDGDGAVALEYRINPIPTTFMIDADGIIQHKSYGAMDYDTMMKHLEQIK